MSLVAFVVNRTLLRDPRRFAQRCRAAAEDRGWDPWFAPDPAASRAAADRTAPGRATAGALADRILTGRASAGGVLAGRAPAGRALADRAAADSPALTRQAIAAGADLVVAAGGDGTVRACAEALAGTGVPLAIVPLGTANLVARALGVPGRSDRALEVAFGGRDRLIDLGRVTGADEGIVFAAMAGIGLDAAVVGAAWPRVKRRLGWVAYGMAAVPRLGWPASDFTIRVDGAAPVRRRARCVVVANAGLLPGGFTLLPAARLDDGLLDVGILAPAGGWDWARLGGQILGGQILGGRTPGGRVPGGRGAGLDGGRGRLVQVSADRMLPRQADGEILVPGQMLGASVTPGALVLRLAR